MDEAQAWLTGWLREGLQRLCQEPVEVEARRLYADTVEFVVTLRPGDYGRLHGEAAAARRALAELVAAIGARHHGIFLLSA